VQCIPGLYRREIGSTSRCRWRKMSRVSRKRIASSARFVSDVERLTAKRASQLMFLKTLKCAIRIHLGASVSYGNRFIKARLQRMKRKPLPYCCLDGPGIGRARAHKRSACCQVATRG
jgi:hypothetical protein